MTTDIESKYFAHPWKMETLINELLTTKKILPKNGKTARVLDCKNFNSVANVLNVLGQIENAEDGITLKRVDVMQEVHRLGQRQFEWQRGFMNLPLFYRSHFIYGGKLTSEFFERRYNVTLIDFTLFCFALRAMFTELPGVKRSTSFSDINISSEQRDACLRLISLDIAQARTLASSIRSGLGHVSYKRSILRTHPCIEFPESGGVLVAPLPDLVMLRATSGLFYDVIQGGDNVRNEIAFRFEEYSRELLAAYLPSLNVDRSYKYKYKKNLIDSPDIFVRENGRIRIILECKATRMSYEARFSEDPLGNARRGYDEIAKGIFQIWRFISHIRRGIVQSEQLSQHTIGIVLTLDTWLTMANVMQKDVVDAAKQMCLEKDPEIIALDQIPVIFCPIDELENTLSAATECGFMAAVDAASQEQFEGWMLGSVHREICPDENTQRTYPFADRVEQSIPWWGKFGHAPS
ncbi:hypothetical protein [Methylobacterium fujisawaense]